MDRRAPCVRRLESSCAQWLKPAGSFPSLENSDGSSAECHECVREAAAAVELRRTFESVACPVPICEVQCATAAVGADVDGLAEDGLAVSAAWPVPIEALQWGEPGTPVAAGAVALPFAAWPVPIAAVQSVAALAYADEADSRAAMKVMRSVFMVDRSCRDVRLA
jgi:hypothetical protein